MSDDLGQRRLALDTGRSFIVQAPAGSGKTELLIQRYLALLARVERPEQVVAITFTRKAAAEMRRRVLGALAEAGGAAPPAESHRRQTFELAREALQRSTELEWNLELQPHRLRIDTLDAMNAWLAQHLPLLAGGVGGAEPMEDASECYELAIQRTLEALGRGDALDAALTRLLGATDNNAARLERLLGDLLPTRDQWLPYAVSGTDEELRERLESALRRLIDESLRSAARALPPGFAAEVEPLLRHAAQAAEPSAAPAFAAWRRPETVLEPSAEHLDAWRALPELLLTRSASRWKQRLTKREGFGPDDAAMRERLGAVLAAHEDDETLRAAIQDLRELPASAYEPADWELIAALRRSLRHLVAELKLVFAERRSADFVELALSAQQALGQVDEPSELLLALDRRIQHVLVDEFQDTSHTQLRLLGLLTAGWEAGDGRTLFLVGDPMQSIYRFRHADMSLFLKTKAQGIGDVELESLRLESNFRSAPAVVDWVNRTFSTVFPERDDIGAGAARFHACRATRPEAAGQAVEWHALRGAAPAAETARVTEILQRELRANPGASVAVLVRSRSHLAGLQEQLRARGLPAHAVELDAPCERQVIQDLIGLTRALSHLGDRIAWLGVLRAPWCGLTWSDLLKVAAGGPERTVWSLIRDEQIVDGLGADGRERLRRTRTILAEAFECRGPEPFELWVERTWVRLGGPACLELADEAASVERFFAVLAATARRGELDDPAALEDRFAAPHGQGEPPRETGIEIMTIHRAKGLEFDSVILPGLARPPRSSPARALYWLERTADDGHEDLLLAPLSSSASASGTLTEFIKRADSVRDRAESARLLYVAATRARERLHLVARLEGEASRPPSTSLLQFVWAQAQPHFEAAEAQDTAAGPQADFVVPELRRLRELPTPDAVAEARPTVPPRPEFVWASFAAAQVGTIVHAALQDIGTRGITGWSRASVHARRTRFERELRLLGVDDAELDHSVERIVEALCAVLEDPRGRWLLAGHPHAASELPLTMRVSGRLEHVRIDRTFVDEHGVRWIVDFKTSLHEGGDVAAFVDSEVERYRAQLGRYAEAMRRVDDRPIRVGLYFPLLQAFRSWPAETGSPIAERPAAE